ncbi:MAG: glycosyltransferase [Terricaulis sp.]
MDKFPSRERQSACALATRVSAIVVVGGDAPRTQGQSPLDLCLRSLLSEPWVDELIIVDHGAPRQMGTALRSLGADRRDVRIVEIGPRQGLAAAINLGAAQATGRWLLILDPQVVLKRGAVERLTAAGGGARGPWIVGGRLTDMSGRDRSEAVIGPLSAWSALSLALGPQRAPRRGGGNVSAVSDAFMLLPRQDFDALGGFDPYYAGDYADLDFCSRVAALGGSVLFEPEAEAVQVARRSARGRKRAQGLARFAAKSARTPLQACFALVAAPTLAALLVLKDWVIGRRPRG